MVSPLGKAARRSPEVRGFDSRLLHSNNERRDAIVVFEIHYVVPAPKSSEPSKVRWATKVTEKPGERILSIREHKVEVIDTPPSKESCIDYGPEDGTFDCGCDGECERVARGLSV